MSSLTKFNPRPRTITNYAVVYIRLDYVNSFLKHPDCPELLRTFPANTTEPVGHHQYMCWDITGYHTSKHAELRRILGSISTALQQTHTNAQSMRRSYPTIAGLLGVIVGQHGYVERYSNWPGMLQHLLKNRDRVQLRQRVLDIAFDRHTLFLTKASLMSLKLSNVAPTLLAKNQEIADVFSFDQQNTLCHVPLDAWDDEIWLPAGIRGEQCELVKHLAAYCQGGFQLLLHSTKEDTPARSLGTLSAFPLQWVTQVSVLGAPVITHPHVALPAASVEDMLSYWLAEVPF